MKKTHKNIIDMKSSHFFFVPLSRDECEKNDEKAYKQYKFSFTFSSFIRFVRRENQSYICRMNINYLPDHCIFFEHFLICMENKRA